MSEPQEPDRPELPGQAPGTVRESGGWTRLPYLILFVIVYEVVKTIVVIVMVVQFVLRVTVGRPNERIGRLGRRLALYAREVIEFLTFATDDIPYPFGAWSERTGSDPGDP